MTALEKLEKSLELAFDETRLPDEISTFARLDDFVVRAMLTLGAQAPEQADQAKVRVNPEASLPNLVQQSVLPEEPDTAVAEKLLIELHSAFLLTGCV